MSDNGIRLIVENLGPIGHASVEVRPLTVLIGRNNTGKTYLAQALYASFRAIEDLLPRPTELLTSDERELLARTLNKAALEGSDTVTLPLDSLSPVIQQKAAEWHRHTLHTASKALERRLLACFSEPELTRISRWDQSETVSVELRDTSGTSRYFGTGVNAETDLTALAGIDTVWHIPLPDQYAYMTAHDDDEVDDDLINHEYSMSLAANVWRSFLREAGLDGSAHYLPAGRSGLLHAWTDVVKLRLELERERYGLPGIPDTSLDGVALDFILSLAGILGRRNRRRMRRYGFQLTLPGFWHSEKTNDSESMKLLRQLMQGEIHAGADEDMVPTLDYRQEDNRIAVRRASSMVADLAPLAMWIDQIVESGDVLIIDEPESHLHPEAIRLVARVLVRLVNEGVRVVCATHSPILLHELSNCLLRGKLSDSNPDALGAGYLESDILQFEAIAVHRFIRPDVSEPVSVVPVKIEEDWGIPEDEYVKVASELSDDSARLIDLLK